MRNIIENILESGYTPNAEQPEISSKSIVQNNDYTVISALDFALNLKKSSVSNKTFSDYKYRVGQFQKFLKSNGLENTPISNITKKEINDFLNSVLLKSSPRNRNNTLAVLNAIFSTLEENEIIQHNNVEKKQEVTS